MPKQASAAERVRAVAFFPSALAARGVWLCRRDHSTDMGNTGGRAGGRDADVPVPMEKLQTIAEEELARWLRHALLGGRLALFLAELVVALLRANEVREAGPDALVALGLLCLYNFLALGLLSGRRVTAKLAGAVVGGDLLTVGALVAITNGVDGPFVGLFYLVTLLAAVHHDLPGGVLTGGAAALIVIAASGWTADFWHLIARGEARTQVIPYLILHGAVAGFLVSRLKLVHARRLETEQKLRSLEMAEERRRHEGEIARDIQQAALTPAVAVPGLEIAVHFAPAEQVGGDFYSFAAAGERLGVVIGDVSGKGLPAALTATSVSHLSRALDPLYEPRHFFSALNRSLVGHVPEGTFVTVALVILEPSRGRVTVYSAGHPPPILVSGGAATVLDEGVPPLGWAPEVSVRPLEARWAPGDMLLLYTDGLVDARTEDGRPLGLDGVIAAATCCLSDPVDAVPQRLLEAAGARGHSYDDLTLIVVRHAGEREPGS
jgi:serine phosphatase RsbU (regulator of sigma subunit)